MREKKRTIREEAVARMRNESVPLLDLAREYGVSTNTLRTWLKESEARARAQEDARRVAAALSDEVAPATATPRERLLMHAVEYSPATIIITDAEGKVVYANPKFAETTGYAIADVIGKNPRILKSGETTPDEYRQLWKTILAGKEWRGTFHNRCKNGKLYWERASISPVFDSDGKISHFMAVKEDITELMETELASRSQSASFQAVFAALPWAILVIKENGDILFANAAAETLTGMPLPVGSSFDQLNLRWVDDNGTALTKEDHPIQRLFAAIQANNAADTEIAEANARIGIVPPTGGVRWANTRLRRIDLPFLQQSAVLLIIE